MRKERERGQNHKKGRNDCHILDENDSLHVLLQNETCRMVGARVQIE